MHDVFGSGKYSLKVTSEYELFGKWIKNRYVLEMRFENIEDAKDYMKRLIATRAKSIVVDDRASEYVEQNPTDGCVMETEETKSGPWRTRWLYTIEET